MKIANASTRKLWPLSRQPLLPARAERSRDFVWEPRFSLIASLIAIGGVLLTPFQAVAQEEAAPPPATDAAPAPEAPPAAEPAPDAAAPEAAEPEAADPGAAEGEEEAPPLESTPAGPPPDVERDSIVVTGYRKSLKAALNKKKKATGQVDAIVAEDMADFPDQNLAESLQRMPGVAMERADGEGSRITVRGLGSRYTRTRVNGMDARAAVRGNSTRAFDFNMFASELFNSIVVHKTATAELGEGALGAVVDLNSARAFDYEKGFTFLVGGQGGYNDLSNSFFPRVTGLVSYHAPSGLWGATASIAYSGSRLDTAAAETVRWQRGNQFRSVNGVICADVPDDPGCAEVREAFHPRIPRYAYYSLEGDRIGVTGGLQFRPTKKLEIKLDGLYAKYDTTLNQNTLEVLFRGNEGLMDITNYRLQRNPARFGVNNDTLTAATVNNAWARSEAYRQVSENDFKQVTLTADLDVTDEFYIRALGGISRSSSALVHDTTLMYDDRDYNGYTFDYANQQLPSLVYAGPNVNDPANFLLTELRDEPRAVDVAYDVADLGFNWDVIEQLTMSLGGSYKAERMSLSAQTRSGSACRPALFDCDTNDDMMNDVLGPQARPDNSDAFEYPGDVGAGSNTRWTSPNIDRWVDELNFYDLAATNDLTNIREVSERSVAGYLQGSGEVPLGNMRLAYNAGVRYVRTYQTSAGYRGPEWFEVERDPYNDVLPSASTALWLTDDFVTRLAGARVMSRPELGDLSPGATIDSFNYRITRTNPYLDPTRAWALDLGAEWYFADESVLGLAGFAKKIDSFPETLATPSTYAETGYPVELLQPTSPAAMNPEGQVWDISNRVNGRGATILGAELGFAAPFNAFTKALPVVLRDMGVTGNYTVVYSKFPWGFLPMQQVDEKLAGLSTHSANATLYYDDDKFSLRASLAWRSEYISAPGSALNVPSVAANQNGNLFSIDEPPPRLDLSSSYKITKDLQVTAEALNLTDAANNTLVDKDARRQQTYGVSGRTFFLGARFSMNFGPDGDQAKNETKANL
jgi:iron complex outermembrane receptor protein